MCTQWGSNVKWVDGVNACETSCTAYGWEGAIIYGLLTHENYKGLGIGVSVEDDIHASMEGPRVFRLLVMGRPVDHYKLLPWMCAAIERGNPNSRAFVKLEGVRFKHMFVAYGACLNGFFLGCQKMLFIDGSHLSGSYEGTLLGAIALDADDHLFDVAYAIVSGKNNANWYWFLSVLYECLGGMKSVIMTDRHQSLLLAVSRVFGLENHCYC